MINCPQISGVHLESMFWNALHISWIYYQTLDGLIINQISLPPKTPNNRKATLFPAHSKESP